MGTPASAEKADPSIEAGAKKALLTRQLMNGLPNDMKIKLLEHDPTPKLDDMLSFVRRYRVVQRHLTEHQVGQNDKLSELMDLLKQMTIATPVGRGSKRNDRERNPVRR